MTQMSTRQRATALPMPLGARLRRRAPHGLCVLATLLLQLVVLLAGHEALAQGSKDLLAQQRALQKKLNDSALMILAGHQGTTYFTMARDIAAALAGSDDIRLIAMDAAGGTESLRDLLFLRGVDLALVPANVLVDANTSATFGPGLPQRLTYITHLYGEEVHFVVGPAVRSFEQLRGRKIAVAPEDGNAEFTVRDMLRRLKVEAEVIRIAPADAIDDVRSGEVAALVLTGGKPLRFVAGLPKDGSLRLLALPFAPALGDGYSPSAFRSDDYPALIPAEQTIDTISVSAVLVAKNTRLDDSYRRIARFVPAFFGGLSELAGPQRHPKWREVNLAAPLAGWWRFSAAEEWLARAKQEQSASVQRSFEAFLSTKRGPGAPPLSPSQQKELFEDFVKWTRKSIATPNQPERP
jgi:uncharacterized protein